MLTANDLDQFNRRIPEVMPTIQSALLPSIHLFVRSQFDEETSEDILQDAFLKLWESTKCFTNEKDLKNYFFKITRNNCANLHRRNTDHFALINGTSLEMSIEEAHTVMARDAADIETDLELLRRLAPKAALVAELSFIEGKTNEQVAKEVQISVSTVKRCKTYAIQILKQLLNNRLLFITVISAGCIACSPLFLKKTFKFLALFNHFFVFIQDQY